MILSGDAKPAKFRSMIKNPEIPKPREVSMMSFSINESH
jgi:hypothetical protein